MSAPLYAASDYLAALQALMPRGRVWPKDPDSVQSQTLACYAPTFVRSNQSANDLLADAFPANANAMLPEWESTLGLPDPCAGEAPTLQQRQGQVIARLTNSGGQSVAFFVAYAKALGFDITITQCTPFRMGQQSMGCGLGNNDWAYTWLVNAPAQVITYFSMAESYMGQPLASWGNAVLECELNAIKPAHTYLNFSYGQKGALNNTFILNESSLG